MNATWKDNKSHDLEWKIIDNIGGGGQGDAFKVQNRKSNAIGFLKIIKQYKIKERRERFFREASVYDTVNITGIPKLIESNAHCHKDMSCKPYIITEFIEGNTLRKWREAQYSVDLPTAITLTISLLSIIGKCHERGIIHRDIKPDNIILLNSDAATPFLLDFGLNYHEIENDPLKTFDFEELGNRFLRLPELSSHSPNKQDPRSDITFSAGILFYILTGNFPNVLIDSNGEMPHQRRNLSASLRKIELRSQTQLLSIFDNCFNYMIEKRFYSAESLQNRLKQIGQPVEVSMSSEDDFKEIQELLNTPIEKDRVLKISSLNIGLQKIASILGSISLKFSGALTLMQRNWEVLDERGTADYSWSRSGTGGSFVLIKIKILINGNELVVNLSGQDIYRTSLAEPEWGGALEISIQNSIYPKLKAALTYPDLHIPEIENFQDIQPFTSISNALLEAKTKKQKALIFVYDKQKKDRGQLDWALKYFLFNEKTRNLINSNFVTALVPLDDFTTYSDILNEESMETARWVLIDENANVFTQSVITGNPGDAEKLISQLIIEYKQVNRL